MAAINVTLFLPMIVRITQTCPRTADEWREASDRLGCQYDSKDVQNRYHCVPSQDKSSLLEFCLYDTTRTLVTRGNCLELSNSGSLNFEECYKSFSYGCPTENYFSDEMYKHPTCLEINREKKCFVAAKGCGKPTVPNKTTKSAENVDSTTENGGSMTENRDSTTENGGSMTENRDYMAENGESMTGYILSGVLAVIFIVVVIFIKRKAIRKFMVSLPCGSRFREEPSHQEEPMRQEDERRAFIDATNTQEQPQEPDPDAHIDTPLDDQTIRDKDPNINMAEGQTPRREVLKLDSKTSIDECQKIVAAVDFGTSHSGYCFSTNEDYQNDPLKITSPRWEFSSWQKAFSMKTPTTILLDKDKQVKCFGFDAEMEYADMEETEHNDYFYFQRFKMEISRKKVTKGEDVKIQDVLGKELSASFVIGRGIQYLKEELLRQIGRTSLENIYWVFTYPSLWDFDKQDVLEEAVKLAGISKSNFVLTEEAQAVSYYLHHLPYYRQDGTSNTTVFVEGRKYLLLDAGGGTIDITVNLMQRDGTSKTLTKCSGPYGGTTVDNAFESTIRNIVGEQLMESFIKTHPADYIEMIRNFEVLKRKDISRNVEKVLLRIPITLKDMYEAKIKPDISNAVQRAGYHGKLTWEDDKFRMTKDFFISLFDEAFIGIKQSIKDTLDKEEAWDTDIILMVGGFSESSQLQQIILDEFMSLNVIVLPEPGLAVLRGAVLYGHQPVVFHACGRTPCKNN